MAVGYSDPIGDVTAEWERFPVEGDHHSCIDDGVRQPAVPNVDDYIYYAGVTTRNDDFTMSPLGGVGIASQIKVWAYGKTYDDGVASADLYIGGSWQRLAPLGLDALTPSWKSVTYTGGWTQAQLNARIVRLNRNDSGPDGDPFIYAMYQEVTYTPSSAGGWGWDHFPDGGDQGGFGWN